MVFKRKLILKTVLVLKVDLSKLLQRMVIPTYLVLLKRDKIWPKNAILTFLFAGPKRLDISQVLCVILTGAYMAFKGKSISNGAAKENVCV